ncbi:uncharacterized protein LODBEIA_P16910 [Lodderomyces beijingensis]|uniref:Core-binding (CB) domain-containing protein n=1 Tax=Lodderomyces beijingensis TaxID=1775926 RepID=A0ABP0ZH21_9ASCO
MAERDEEQTQEVASSSNSKSKAGGDNEEPSSPMMLDVFSPQQQRQQGQSHQLLQEQRDQQQDDDFVMDNASVARLSPTGRKISISAIAPPTTTTATTTTTTRNLQAEADDIQVEADEDEEIEGEGEGEGKGEGEGEGEAEAEAEAFEDTLVAPAASPEFGFGSTRRNHRTAEEQALLTKFENEILKNQEAMKTLNKLRNETKEKYLYQMKRYIRFCASKGLDNFFVTLELAKELVDREIVKRGSISENTIKSIRSPLNKLYAMNEIVYGSQQPDAYLGDQFIKDIVIRQQQRQQEQQFEQLHLQRQMEDNEPSTNSGSTGGGSGSLLSLNKAPTSLSQTASSSIVDKSLPSTDASISPPKRANNMEEDANLDVARNPHPGGTSRESETQIKTLPSSSTSSSSQVNLNPKFARLSESTKHRLSDREEVLLRKFDDEVLESTKTQDILQNLTENTFKSYATDIKRFIRFCARKGKNDSLIDENILTRFLQFEASKNRKYKLKNVRTSLLKLHQLNCLAYDLEFLEGNIVLVMNRFLDNNNHNHNHNSPNTPTQDSEQQIIEEEDEDDEHDHLVVKLKELYETSNVLRGLSDASKKLYSNDFNRYASFCSRIGLQHFDLSGELILRFFKEDIISRAPTITSKKLQEILSRLSRLHTLNVELKATQSETIENVELVKSFLKEYNNNNNNSSSSKTNKPQSAATTDSAPAAHKQGEEEEVPGSGKTSGSSTNGTGASTLSGASLSSTHTQLPQLNFSNDSSGGGVLDAGSSSSEQTSNGELITSTNKTETTTPTPTVAAAGAAGAGAAGGGGTAGTASAKGGGRGAAAAASSSSKKKISTHDQMKKNLFQSYSSRADVVETSSSISSGKPTDELIVNELRPKDRISENANYPVVPLEIEADPLQEGSSNANAAVVMVAASAETEPEEDKGEESEDEKEEDIAEPVDTSPGPKRSLKRQRTEEDKLPETNDSIPKFVMNRNIDSVTQVVEEWTLIIKRKQKYDLGWIKSMIDFQIYNSRKLIIDLIEELLPLMDEKYEGVSLSGLNYSGDDADIADIFEIAKVFDQYLDRKKMTLAALVRKIETYPIYTKREFSRVLTRRQTNFAKE